MLISLEQLVQERQRLRQLRIQVTMTAGNFDLFHAGHVWFLAEAATFGDVLIVQLADDDLVNRCKGPGRPVFQFEERAAILDSIRWVDYVIKDSVYDGLLLVRHLSPDVFVRGADYDETSAPEISVMKEMGGRMVFAKSRKLSSREIIRRIREETM